MTPPPVFNCSSEDTIISSIKLIMKDQNILDKRSLEIKVGIKKHTNLLTAMMMYSILKKYFEVILNKDFIKDLKKSSQIIRSNLKDLDYLRIVTFMQKINIMKN